MNDILKKLFALVNYLLSVTLKETQYKETMSVLIVSRYKHQKYYLKSLFEDLETIKYYKINEMDNKLKFHLNKALSAGVILNTEKLIIKCHIRKYA